MFFWAYSCALQNCGHRRRSGLIKKIEPKKIGEIWIEMGMGLRPLGNEAYYAYSGGCRHRNGESVYSRFVMV